MLRVSIFHLIIYSTIVLEMLQIHHQTVKAHPQYFLLTLELLFTLEQLVNELPEMLKL